jgi:hypothetical protein
MSECAECIGQEVATEQCKVKDVKLVVLPNLKSFVEDNTCTGIQKGLYNYILTRTDPTVEEAGGYQFLNHDPCVDVESGKIKYPLNTSSAYSCNDEDWSTNVDTNDPFHKDLYCQLYAARNIHACEYLKDDQQTYNADDCPKMMPDALCPDYFLQKGDTQLILLNEDDNKENEEEQRFSFSTKEVCNEDGRVMFPMDNFSSNACNDVDWSANGIDPKNNTLHRTLFCRLYHERNLHACKHVSADFESCEKIASAEELCQHINKESLG